MCVERVGSGEGAYVCGVVGGVCVGVEQEGVWVCVCGWGVMWRGMYVGGEGGGIYVGVGGICVCRVWVWMGRGYVCDVRGGDEGGDGVHVRCTCFHCGVWLWMLF